MRTIWKYPLNIGAITDLWAPKDAQWLCVRAQYERPCVWALVDSGAEKRNYRFRMVITGHGEPDALPPYFGTVFLDEGKFVGHIFGPELAEQDKEATDNA